jgi:hypothetical protein
MRQSPDADFLFYNFPMPLRNAGASGLHVFCRALAGWVAPLLVALGRP